MVSSRMTTLPPEPRESGVVLISVRMIGDRLSKEIVRDTNDGVGARKSLGGSSENEVMVDLSLGCLWSPAKKTTGASLAKRGRSEGIDRQTMLMLHSRMLHIRGSAR